MYFLRQIKLSIGNKKNLPLLCRIKASDQDPYDQLNYDIVDSTGLFDIDHSKGTIIALEGLDVGVYTLNISVSDGKFTSFGEAIVTVDLITDEMLDESVILRFQYIEPENFILSYQNGLVKMIKSILCLSPPLSAALRVNQY